MDKHSAHTRPWETAEAILATALLLGLALGYLLPLPLSALAPRALSVTAGIILILLSLWMISITRGQFRQTGQPTDPGHPTTRLITTGIFSWSRNPLYLAGMIFLAGLAALIDSTWLLVLLLPTAAAFHFILIAPEERYLEAKFGGPYRQYCGTVRRWIGRKKS